MFYYKGRMVMDFITLCIHGNHRKYDNTGAISVPIFQLPPSPILAWVLTAMIIQGSRTHREHLERTGGKAEGGIDNVFPAGWLHRCPHGAFSLGDHIIASDDIYGGSHRLFFSISKKNGLDFSLVDT